MSIDRSPENVDALVVTVQPAASSATLDAAPGAPGPALVPPSQSAVPFDWPAASSDVRKLSTLVSVRAQLKKQSVQSVQDVLLSNKFAGTVVRLVQSKKV